jgi:putative transposase
MAEVGARIRVSVAVACRVLGRSTQGYYKWLKEPVCQRDVDDAHTINVLHRIHTEDPTLGYRFLTDELAQAGIAASESRVHRLCHIASIRACHASKKSKAGKPGPPVHDDLLAFLDADGRVRHDLTAKGPNEKWFTDITKRPKAEGKLYLCAVKDCYSNKIVGYSIDSRIQSSLAATALQNAIAFRSPVGTICHSDRDSQFGSKAVMGILRNNGLKGSMGRVASAGDNAAMESFSPCCTRTS